MKRAVYQGKEVGVIVCGKKNTRILVDGDTIKVSNSDLSFDVKRPNQRVFTNKKHDYMFTTWAHSTVVVSDFDFFEDVHTGNALKAWATLYRFTKAVGVDLAKVPGLGSSSELEQMVLANEGQWLVFTQDTVDFAESWDEFGFSG